MALRDGMQTELRAAMRRRDSGVVAGLRSAMSALANAEAIAPPEITQASSHGYPTAAVADEGESHAAASSGQAHFAGSVSGLGAAEAARRELTIDQERAIVAVEIAQLEEHAARLAQMCRHDAADAAHRAARTLTAILDRTPPD